MITVNFALFCIVFPVLLHRAFNNDFNILNLGVVGEFTVSD